MGASFKLFPVNENPVIVIMRSGAHFSRLRLFYLCPGHRPRAQVIICVGFFFLFFVFCIMFPPLENGQIVQ